MAEFNQEGKVEGVFGGVDFNTQNNTEQGNIQSSNETVFTKMDTNNNLPSKPTIWSKIKSVLFTEIDWNAPIKVELTPYQQKVEDEVNEFLHQEVSFKGFFDFISGKN